MRLFFALIFILSFNTIDAQNGLKFISNNKPKEERSQLIFDNKFTANDSLVINFQFSIYNKLFIGDLLNIRNNRDNSTISLSYNFTYSGENKPYLNLNVKGIKNLLSIPIPENFVQYQTWMNLNLKIDYNLNNAELTFLNETFTVENLFENSSSLNDILFGKNEFNEDIPAFALKKLKITSDDNFVYFPLDEKQGTAIYSARNNYKGKVINPLWLIEDYKNWHLIQQFELNSNHQIVYDSNKTQFLIIGKNDSYNLDVVSGRKEKNKQSIPSNFHSYTSGKTFLNKKDNRVLMFQTGSPNISENKFLNKKLGIESIKKDTKSNFNSSYSIASLDTISKDWKRLYINNIFENPLFHFNANYDNVSENILIFGGYSDFQYKNDFYLFDISSSVFNKLLLRGDKISPRFRSGIGRLDDGTLLVYGGEGNLSGDQSIGKIPFNDLYNIDLNNNSINLVWEKEYDYARNSSSKNLILNDSQEFFYCLVDSGVKGSIALSKVSLKDGNRISLGKSISFDSSIIANEFDLFYEEKNNRLYAYTKEFFDNRLDKNIVSFYSIEMEPTLNELYEGTIESNESFFDYKWVLIGFIIIILLTIFIIFRKKPIISLKSEVKKDYIFVRSDRSDVKLFFDNVIALEAMKDYTKIIVKENSYMVHGNISNFIKKFPKNKFIRIHRSTVINVDFITSFEGSTVNLGRNHYTIGGKYISDIKKYLN